MEEELKEIIPILEKYEQSHLLDFYQELTFEEKQDLIRQIKKVDFKFLNELYWNSFKNDVIEHKRITPMEYYSKFYMSKEEKEKYIKIGEDIIRKGKIALITLAGGMGSRLGFRGPKGTYELKVLQEKKSLFEFTCDKLKEVKEKYGVCLTWFIMTSPSNDEKTKEFFEEHQYFNYPKNKVKFFTQRTINILDINGKVMLDGIGKLKRDSNGNGDVFEAFAKANFESEIENVEWIEVAGVDNILLEIIDPLLLGLTKSNNSCIASKSTRKNELKSKTWVFANLDGKADIINPVFLTDAMKYSKNSKGQYNYNQINILSHLFTKEAFLKCAKLQIPYHRAFKKTDYINEEGTKMVVEEPNSFKFEKFIFDVFKFFDNFTLLEVDGTKEFAPIKSFKGSATPEIALQMYLEKKGLVYKEKQNEN